MGTSAKFKKLATKKSPITNVLILGSILGLASCSGSMTGGLAGGLGGGLGGVGNIGPTITGADISSIVTPAISDGVLNSIIVDTLLAADGSTTAVTQVVAASGASGNAQNAYNAVLGNNTNYSTQYSGGGADAIINGAYASGGGGSAIAMVSAATADDGRPLTSESITDYCAASYPAYANGQAQSHNSLNASEKSAFNNDEFYGIMHSPKTMENGSELRTCDILINRDRVVKEAQLQLALNTSGYVVPSSLLDDAIRLQARREAMYVFVNSFLAFGADFMGLLQYIGLDIPPEVAQLFASSVAVMSSNDWDNGGINYNRWNVRPYADNQELLARKKANTYMFVEQFIDRGTVIDRATAKVEYRIDTEAFCKFFLNKQDTSNDGQIVDPYTAAQNDENLAQCIAAADTYFSRVKFTQFASGTKTIAATYTESQYAPNGLQLFTLSYNLDHSSFIGFDLNELKQFALASMRRELADGSVVAQELQITQERIDAISRITSTGVIGFGSAITDLTMADIEAGQTIADSQLPAKLYASIRTGIEIRIPEDMSDQEVNVLDLDNTDPYAFARMDVGDVYIQIGASEDTAKLEHMRGDSLYEDHLGLNILNLAVQFPPYNLTEDDMFVFDISLNELNGEIRIAKPSATLTALSTLNISKSGVLADVVKLSNAEIVLETVDTTDPAVDANRQLTLTGFTISPWKLDVTTDPLSMPWQLLGTDPSTLPLTTGDYFHFVMHSPNGNYFTDANNWGYTARNGVMDPLYFSTDFTVAALVDMGLPTAHYAGGPYNMPDEGAYYDAAMISIGAKLGLNYADSTLSMSGYMDCTSYDSSLNPTTVQKYVQVVVNRSVLGSKADVYIDWNQVAWALYTNDNNKGNEVVNFGAYSTVSDGILAYDLYVEYSSDGSNNVSSASVSSSWTDGGSGSPGSCSGTLYP